MPRMLYAVMLAALVIAAPAAAQKDMKATAPEKMMPPGAGEAMRHATSWRWSGTSRWKSTPAS